VPTSEDIVRELESFYRHQIDVFNRKDPGFYDCFARSYGILSAERGLTTIVNDENHRNGFRRTMVALR
jgi:hypothetical protein